LNELHTLLLTTLIIGTIHTLIGVDHYVPFIAMNRVNGWSIKKTMLIVLACGIGHVLSSVLLGFAGIGLSIGLSTLVNIESVRGELATYFLIAFGLIYMLWGIKSAYNNRPHRHITPVGHAIEHVHRSTEHIHNHQQANGKKSRNAFWSLFILFALGPCEPLIPIIMYPAATMNTFALVSVTLLFSVCTIATMLVATYTGIIGINLIKIQKFESYSHILAGFSIFSCGLMIMFFNI